MLRELLLLLVIDDACVAHSWQLLACGHGGLGLTTQTDCNVTQAQAIHLHVVIVAGQRRFCTRGHRVPTLTILVKVKILAPFDQIVHLVIEVLIIDILELLVIERIVVQRLELLLKASGLHCSLIDSITLLSNQLGILGVSIQLSKPLDLAVSALLRCQFLS